MRSTCQRASNRRLRCWSAPRLLPSLKSKMLPTADFSESFTFNPVHSQCKLVNEERTVQDSSQFSVWNDGQWFWTLSKLKWGDWFQPNRIYVLRPNSLEARWTNVETQTNCLQLYVTNVLSTYRQKNIHETQPKAFEFHVMRFSLFEKLPLNF